MGRQVLLLQAIQRNYFSAFCLQRLSLRRITDCLEQIQRLLLFVVRQWSQLKRHTVLTGPFCPDTHSPRLTQGARSGFWNKTQVIRPQAVQLRLSASSQLNAVPVAPHHASAATHPVVDPRTATHARLRICATQHWMPACTEKFARRMLDTALNRMLSSCSSAAGCQMNWQENSRIWNFVVLAVVFIC